jgi:hypothetical protein
MRRRCRLPAGEVEEADLLTTCEALGDMLAHESFLLIPFDADPVWVMCRPSQDPRKH